jgi:pSer/pThr/pTyr-binding forkhead associated (FHA) protein
MERAVVGRSDPVSNFYPDIDLQPHDAMEQGVGRRHVLLLVRDNQVFAEDLDSTNGSFLNRKRLIPRVPQPVQSGDELRLGTMVLTIQIA